MAAKLSDVEIFYVEQNPDNLSDNELATKMKRNLLTIKKIKERKIARDAAKVTVEPTPEPPAPLPVEEQTSKSKNPTLRKSFGHVRKGGHSLATVMTPAASELGDSSRKKGKKPFSEQFKDCVFKPYGDNHGE